MKRWIWTLLLVVSLVRPGEAQAEGPDYGLPGGFALPWDCGQGYRISWDPEGHWAYGKATGIAYDLAMEEGVPLYAPFNGMAYFGRDERPYDTNLGHYVELVDDSGYWLVRLAHLRDAQQGQRRVRAGELVGHSGSSGATSAHLHLELLVREGGRWVRPDPQRLERLFGLSSADLQLGAYVVNLGCPAQLTMAGEITASQPAVALGEGVELRVPLRNQGLQALRFDLLQLALFAADGSSAIVEARGDWQIEGQGSVTIPVVAHLPSPGVWYAGRVTCRTEEGVTGVPARGQVEVWPSPLRFVGLGAYRGALAVGDLLRLYVWVANDSAQEVQVQDLFVEGLRPDGVTWRALHGTPLTLAPGEVQRVPLEAATPLQQVGVWRVQQAGYVLHDREHRIGSPRHELMVRGPQLVVERVELLQSVGRAHVFLQVRNVGTALAEPDAVEIWGWRPNGDSFAERVQPVAPLEPQRAALLQLDLAIAGAGGVWRLVEAGYWQRGSYFRMALPMQPALAAPLPPAAAGAVTLDPSWPPLRSPAEGRPSPR